MVINVQYSVHTYSINTNTITCIISLQKLSKSFRVYHNGCFSVRQMIVTPPKKFFFLTKTQNRHFNIYIPEKCTRIHKNYCLLSDSEIV